MVKEEPGQPGDLLDANRDDPHLTVHGLSEFTFCPRAGVCLYEQDAEFQREDEEPNASFLPIFEREELARSLKFLLTQFWSTVLGGLVAVGAFGFIAWITGTHLLWLAALAFAVVALLAAYNRGYWAFVAWQHLDLYQRAEGVMPDPESKKTQDLHWCELLAAGFELIAPPEPYYHENWKLGGSPWRILQYADLRIPVFHFGPDWQGLYPQHFVRMAAYCRLLEECEGYQSPYGVIVQGRTYAAVTVPNSPENREALRRQLIAARKTVRATEERNEFPRVGSLGNVCVDCRFGEPVALSRGVAFLRNGNPIPVRTVRSFDSKLYHSLCGDRFRWVPPHEGAVAKGLPTG